jgi:hypothetical protein
MSAERNLLGEHHRHEAVGKQARATKTACVRTAVVWRETIARPFIPSGPSSALAMPPLLRREPAA